MPNPVVAVGAAGVGASAYGGRQAKKGAEAAAEAQVRAAELGIEEQRLAREALEKRLQPFVELGGAASPYLQQLMGLPTEQAQRLQTLLGDGSTTGQGTPGSLRHTEYLRDFYKNRLEHGQPDSRQRVSLTNRVRKLNEQLEAGRAELAALQKDPLAQPLDSQIPDLPQAVDLSQLPEAATAFGPESFKDNPMLDFVLKEGFRGIREGAAGRGRVPDRDLVEFAQGTASTLLPALQAQQFGQQQALRSQALGEQAQRFGQLGGLRESAIGEQQRSISNLQSLLGMGQSAAAGQGAAGLSTGANISNLLGNIGTAQAQGALGAAQAQQAMGGNIAGLSGLLGGLMQQPKFRGDPYGYVRPTYADGSQQAGPFLPSGQFN